ncbi:MAG: hypothetical protein LBL97_02150 [Prevotellaceae bacterium]|jgi:RHS repeat-associated protein|nr:hypothetical protein [Prevotellaceae bacterium]
MLSKYYTADLRGVMVYENNTLKRILVDGGYIENGTYYYYLTDHLGNNRVVANASGTVQQTNHYYPYGMLFGTSVTTTGQPYKYGAKEFDGDKNLFWSDFEARQYYATVPGFTTMDPLAEKYPSMSPYVYCAGNPINAIDPDGRDWYRHNDTGNYLWIEGHEEKDGYTWLGATVSFKVGDKWFNAYQNGGGFRSDREMSSFEIVNTIGSYPTLIEGFLGDNSRLSEEYKSELFNSLVNQDMAEIGQPIGMALTEIAAAEFGGALLGKALSWAIKIIGKTAGSVATKSAIQFGNKPNQVYHTFRHIDQMGLDRVAVSNAVKSDLNVISSSIKVGQTVNRTISVDGKTLQYTVYKLQDGTLNVGRIHGK